MINKRTVSGVILIIISIWFYAALSSFEVVADSFPKSIIVREGIERSANDVAKKLADELGFDLDGAYKSGYNTNNVIEYLISQPHNYRISFYKGKYYEGRITILHILPFSACIFLFLTGLAIIIFRRKTRNKPSI